MMEIYLNIIRVILVLAGIVAGMILLYRYAEKYKLGLASKGTAYGLKKMDTIHLGYKKVISVVEVKDYVLVLGIGEKEMSLLAKWKKEEKTA
ncbi:MAG: flagellar biosynthesis protein FliO [Syntrophorhabdus sp. PtaU1.Bin002]|nr:MAG: flagellar biosynthesis protein FliO [Syntrophorhabdus sp. PtaB.Bin006]OPY66655.1 MAG: flagellar biosynthesis protein FliO [Syntrophorhabdus sp. PtaU1.Bin002]